MTEASEASSGATPADPPQLDQPKGWFKEFTTTPPEPGTVAIMALGSDPRNEVASAFAVATRALQTPQGPPLFSRIHVIASPSPGSDDLEERIRASVVRLWNENAEEPLSATSERRLRDSVVVNRPTNAALSSLLACLKNVTARAAVFVDASAAYTTNAANHKHTIEIRDPFADTVRISAEEDRWTPQLYETALRAIPLAQERNAFVLLWAGKRGPVRQPNVDLLSRLADCIVVLSVPRDAETALLQHMDRWATEFKAGKSAAVLEEIEGLPATNEDRQLIRSQVLTSVGRFLDAYKEVRPLIEQTVKSANPAAQLSLSGMALRAGDAVAATLLLEAALAADPAQEHLLSIAAQIAGVLERDDLRRRATERLVTLFPDGAMALDMEARQLFSRRAYPDVVSRLERVRAETGLNRELAFQLEMAKALVTQADVRGPLRGVAADDPFRPYAVIATCRALSGRGTTEEVLAILRETQLPEPFRQNALDLAFDCLRTLALHKTPNTTEEDLLPPSRLADQLKEPMTYVLDALSRRPSDGATRNRLRSALAPDVAGTTGVGVLVALVLDNPKPGVSPDSPAPGPQRSPTDIEPDPVEFVKRVIEAESRSVLGVGRLPFPVSEEARVSLRKALSDAVQHLGGAQAGTQSLYMCLHAGLLLENDDRSGNSIGDLELLRSAAGSLAVAGKYQAARDLAEAALQRVSESDSPRRRRFAWQTFADIYQRVHNVGEALLAAAASQSVRLETLSAKERFFEASLLVRILRDLGLLGAAAAIVDDARGAVVGIAEDDRYAHRITALECSIKVLAAVQADAAGSLDESEITELAAAIRAGGHAALAARDSAMPFAVLFAQLVPLLPPNALENPESVLGGWGSDADSDPMHRIQLLMTASVNRDNLLDLIKRSSTRHDDDSHFDLYETRVVARRLLNQAADTGNTSDAVFALELLCDYFVDTEAPRDGETPAAKILSAVVKWSTQDSQSRDVPLGTTRPLYELSTKAAIEGGHKARGPQDVDLASVDGDIHLMGLDSQGRLVRVSRIGGAVEVPVIESREVFSRGAFGAWGKTFPRGYGTLDTRSPSGYSDVLMSMEGIGFSGPLGGSEDISIVPTRDLASIPGNLYLVGERFAGELKPVASPPSLSWLRRARENSRTRSGRFAAWMPAADNATALGILHVTLRDALMNTGVQLIRGGSVPNHISGADLAIIAAHGGLSESGAFFRRISDEDRGRLLAKEIARKLSGCGVVILFVCHGGRLDTSPIRGPLVGLPRLLLEGGCRAVVASPWAIEFGVVQRWLPAFLSVCRDGAGVAKATFEANAVEKERCGFHPSRFLAMHVFGDGRQRVELPTAG